MMSVFTDVLKQFDKDPDVGGWVLRSELIGLVRDFRFIVKDAIDKIDGYDQAEGPEELHGMLEECQAVLYKSGLAAIDAPTAPREAP